MKTDEKVLEETKLFRAALPELLRKHRGKWVVFLGGEVKSVHDDELGAYSEAVLKYGTDGGYVVAPVIETTTTPITAGVLFGLAQA